MTDAPPTRRRPGPRPADAEALLTQPLHRVAMAWPETLAVLRERKVRVGDVGGRPLGELSGADDLAEALVQATRWRAP